MGLPYLDQALRVWGRFAGLEVLLMDADTVSETNCIRQPFSISDIGQNKATVLVNRINLFWEHGGGQNLPISMIGLLTEFRMLRLTCSSAALTAARREYHCTRSDQGNQSHCLLARSRQQRG